MPTKPKISLPISDATVSTSGEALRAYLQAGLTPIPLHSAPGGVCTCRKDKCKPGKHPRIYFKALFHRRPTKAEVREWERKWPHANVALLGVGGLAVLDIDDHAIAEVVLADARLENALVVSTTRGAHIYFRESGSSMSGKVCAGVDLKARGGIIVAPPSVIGDHVYEVTRHGKPIEVENAREWSESLLRDLGIMAAVESSSSPPPREPETTTTPDPDWIVTALRDLAPGSRNETFVKVAGKLHRARFPADAIIELLRPHAEGVEFDDGELTILVRGLCDRYESGPPMESGPFPTVSCEELLASAGSSPVRWDVVGLIASASATLLSGVPGCGKTWALLDLAIEVSRGGLWLNKFACAKGSVLYLDEESREELLSKRLGQLRNAKRAPSEDDAEIRFAVMAGVSFSDARAIERLRTTLLELKPRLVVIDSLIRVHDRDENTASEMRLVSGVIHRLVRESGASFVFADHLRKPRAGMAPDPRGSGEKVAFVDQLIVMRRTAAEIAVLHQTKSRFAPELPPFEVRIHDPVAEKETVIAWTGEVSAREEAAHRTADVDTVLRVLEEKAGWTSRLELVMTFKDRIPPKRLDETLRLLCERGRTERENRGTRAFFRPAAVVVEEA